MDQTRP